MFLTFYIKVICIFIRISKIISEINTDKEDPELIRGPIGILEGIGLTDLTGAELVEDERDEMARLMPSIFTDFPTLCNLVYIDFAIYMGPLRCFYGLDVKTLGIRHLKSVYYIEAIVVPDKENTSPAMFDDIGFLISKCTSVRNKTALTYVKYATLINTPRTDDNYEWLEAMNISTEWIHDLYSYIDVDLNLSKRYRLYTKMFRAKVGTGKRACLYTLYESLNVNKTVPYTPCVVPCNPFEGGDAATCPKKFLYTLGSALFHGTQNYLIGVTTWMDNMDTRFKTTKHVHASMGLAIPNRKDFGENFKCAQKIRDYHWINYENEVPLKYYEQFCKNLTLPITVETKNEEEPSLKVLDLKKNI